MKCETRILKIFKHGPIQEAVQRKKAKKKKHSGPAKLSPEGGGGDALFPQSCPTLLQPRRL